MGCAWEVVRVAGRGGACERAVEEKEAGPLARSEERRDESREDVGGLTISPIQRSDGDGAEGGGAAEGGASGVGSGLASS